MKEKTQLARELATYENKLSELLADEGKFVVIHGDEIVGVFESYADALKMGYDKFGIEPFLVKQISAVEQVSYFSRDIGTECHI